MNVTPQFKVDLISGLDERRAKAFALAMDVSPDLVVHDNSTWTAKDLITHLTAFEEDMVDAIQTFLDGDTYRLDFHGQTDIDGFNEFRRQQRIHKTWEEALTEWQHTRDQLRGVIMAFPENKLDVPFSTPFLQKYTLMQAIKGCGIHEKLHMGEIRNAHQAG